jgi:hypothetical protein
LSSRDPDGSIRADLDELGMLDDGIISNRDAARLLELRLTNAGLDVTLDEYPGDHTTWDKALELVGSHAVGAGRVADPAISLGAPSLQDRRRPG